MYPRADGRGAAAKRGELLCNSARAKQAASFVLFGSICLGGCAQVNVISDQGPPKSEWKFGVLAIDVAGSSKNTIVSSSGVGVISTPSGTTLGYSNARIIRI